MAALNIPDVIVSDEYIRGLMFSNDIINKRKLATFLRSRYSLPVSSWGDFGGQTQVLKDLTYCWLLKAYFVGAHESLVGYANPNPEVTSKLQLLKDMYKDADWVHRAIDTVYNGQDFDGYMQYLDIVNPGT